MQTLFEKVQADSRPERRQECLQRPSVIGKENPPLLQAGDGSLHGRPQGTDLVIVVVLADIQLPVFRLANRGGDVISPDETLVADNATGQLEDHLTFRSFQLGHVMLITRDQLGYEGNAARKVRDDQRAVTRCLVFPSPQLTLAGLGPARPQGAVYQGDCSSGGLGCVLGRWPELLRCLSTKGVRNVMHRAIVAWSTPKMSAHTSSVMLL